MTRRLRSAQKYGTDTPSSNPTREENTLTPPIQFIPTNTQPNPATKITLLTPDQPRLAGLNAEELRTLRKKQRRLRVTAVAKSNAAAEYGPHVTNALASTPLFAQHEAGTAVCIDPRGWIVTCAHCFGETEGEWQSAQHKWLLYYTGVAVRVECVVWDARRDLALARVVCIEMDGDSPTGNGVNISLNVVPQFAHVPLSTLMKPARTPIVCIGQPGADDLESTSPRRTEYDLVEISEGRLRGVVPGADLQDNAEIGTLMHDAWTYWGHSGAPLLCRDGGTLLGLHSSWDDATGMRHGVPLVAIRGFLDEHLGSDGGYTVDKGKEVIVIEDSD